MVNIKQHLHPFGTDLFANLHGHFDFVAEIIRMAFHLDIDARVQHFEAEIHLFLLGVARDLFQPLNHIPHPLLARNAPAESRKRYHNGKAGLGGVINAFAEEAFGVFFLVREAFGKAVAGSHGANQAEFLQHRPIVGRDQFHRFQAHLRGMGRQFLNGHGFETPEDDRLIDAIVFGAVRRLQFVGAAEVRETGSGAESQRAAQLLESVTSA